MSLRNPILEYLILAEEQHGTSLVQSAIKKFVQRNKPKKVWKGRKTREWENARRELKGEFAAMGITSCELRLAGCWKDNSLSFAHSAKRRYLTPDQIKEVVLCCTPCHQRIEVFGGPVMQALVRDIISKRGQ